MGAELIAVSIDTKSVHQKWKREQGELVGVKYKMGSDPNGALSRVFGVYDAASGRALRGSFIINPEGVLLNSEVNFYNLGRSIDELLRKFEANLYMARKPTESCPSKWKNEGDETLANT
jgi:peroxiredoxin (alkyl hydroperoxide reductase subunit C)